VETRGSSLETDVRGEHGAVVPAAPARDRGARGGSRIGHRGGAPPRDTGLTGFGDTGHGTPREACRCALSGRLPAAGITHVGVQIL
jgi:hypothetical protein